MKKFALIVFVFQCGIIFSQNDIATSEVEKNKRIQNHAISKYKKLTTKYDFPEVHKGFLKSKYIGFEFDRKKIKDKYEKNSSSFSSKLDSVNSIYERWRANEIEILRVATKNWERNIKRYDFNDDYKDIFITYHFFKSYTAEPVYAKEKFNLTRQSSDLKVFAEELVKRETNYVFNSCSSFEKLDEKRKKYANKKLAEQVSKSILFKIENNEDIFIKRNSSVYCDYINDKIKEKEEKINNKKQKKKDSLFVLKAKDIGLSESKIETILSLIDKQKEDLRLRKERQKDAENSFSELFDNTSVKSKSEIKKEFSKNLSEVIDKNEFAQLFGNLFMSNVKRTSKKILEDLYSKYDFKENQKKKVRKMVNKYHFNLELTKAYYYFDSKLKKQKKASLNYSFKKDFKELMEKFKIPFEGFSKVRSVYSWK